MYVVRVTWAAFKQSKILENKQIELNYDCQCNATFQLSSKGPDYEADPSWVHILTFDLATLRLLTLRLVFDNNVSGLRVFMVSLWLFFCGSWSHCKQ